jgi:periplasmic protein CpxP/Spy
MEKTKLLTFSVIALLLLNLGTLGFLVLSKPNHPRGLEHGRHKPKEVIIEKLHFDANQITQYETLIKSHQDKIKVLDDSIRSTKNQLYELLRKDVVDEKLKITLIDQISMYQRQIDGNHFNHFEAIKKLCKKDQLDDFNELTEELTRIFSKQNRPERR